MPPHHDPIAPPEIAGLQAGQPVEAAIALLGAQRPTHAISDDEPSYDYAKTIFSDVKFLSYPHLGLSIRITEGRVTYILAFSGVPGGYDTDSNGRYDGPLPRGITFSDTFTTVTDQLGPPDDGGELSGAPIPSKWIIYRRLGLSFDFVSETGQLISVGVLVPKP